MTKKRFSVKCDDQGKLIFSGRPAFSNNTNSSVPVEQKQDRRHLLHGDEHIIKPLRRCFNNILCWHGEDILEAKIDTILEELNKNRLVRINIDKSNLKRKVKISVQFAHGRVKNLVAGDADWNKAIENARKRIKSLSNDLNEYCLPLRSFEDIRTKAVNLIQGSLNRSTGRTDISKHSNGIMECLKGSISLASNVYEIIVLLKDFEFSVTLDICHPHTTKENNIWALRAFNDLRTAIAENNNDQIIGLLF